MKRKPARGNRWADHFTRQARKDRYPARSVYKLQEIQRRHKPLHRGARVLDLGCAPGSWLLFAARVVGPIGQVVGLDLKPVTVSLPKNAAALVGDVFNISPEVEHALEDGFDTVLSDMAPVTTGHKNVDALRSVVLCEAVLEIAEKRLQPGGSLVCKIFQGPDFQSFVDKVKNAFRICRIFKPRSSRKASREIYVIGLEFKD
jgi:23S rRNA (uridine2552-2'-O)-methyltransferase